ncbi:fimbrial biogenesis usher protein (plasmid) [Hafnia alvei]|uniref:fimbrial biogenesis usher protein n=1 Tax=Hafnia alvei TaxID=569 RepID=UPI000C9F8B22|nr:fimbrial biogenesis usher protein [Hafnia alvei]MBI0278587.1 fimbrial biogenesis usher protein [Hafnia alvei]PNL03883.1 fimbrial biogenesis outer membrane usher protein [Hafnia alvei]
MRCPLKKSVSILLCVLPFSHCFAEDLNQGQVDFDTDTLKTLGIDPTLGKYFTQEAKFLPGTTQISLVVNGQDKGAVAARFGPDGQLCVDSALLGQGGLIVPRSITETTAQNASSECHDYRKYYPTTNIHLLPNLEKVEIIAPTNALEQPSARAKNYTHGGTAGLLNYSLMSTRNEFDSTSSTYLQGMFDEGLNMDDWMLRSRQNVTKSDGQQNVESLYTYVQHTFASSAIQMKAGQINASNPLLSGAPIYGVQLTPDTALQPAVNNSIVIRGIASSSQARIDVRQQGSLIYSTLVPNGPFALTNIPVINGTSDLDVTVVESDRTQSHFTVSANSFGQSVGAPLGYSFALGKVEGVITQYEQPWMASGAGGWSVTPGFNVGYGSIIANEYEAIGGSVNTSALSNLTLSSQIKGSNDSRHSNQGQSVVLSGNYTAPLGLGLSLSATHNTIGFRDLLDTLDDDDDSQLSKNEYDATVSWTNQIVGAFSLGYSQTKGFSSQDDSRRVTASWGMTFKYFNVSANWQHQLSSENDNNNDDRDDYYNSYRNTNNGDSFYVNISIPLGQQSVNAYSRHDNGSTTYGVQTSGQATDDMGYSVSAERDQGDQENSFYGSVSDNLHYTQLDVSAGASGSDSRNYSATLNGGVALHSGGVTFSPNALEDTFAIAEMSSPVSGVKIQTPSGPTWTDAWGQAVVPTLPAYASTQINIDPTTLPKNADIGNGSKTLKLGRGAVSHVGFGMLTQRRVLLNITLPDGKPVPKGMAITDNSGNYITTAVDDGTVFLPNVDPQQTLFITSDRGQALCQIHFNLPEKTAQDVFYEEITGQCLSLKETP